MNILLVDDHALFREGFKLMLDRLWEPPPTVAEAGTAEAGLAAVAERRFDLIFLDLGLPGLEGLDGLRAFRQASPTTTLVVLSAVEGAEMVRQALLYGAQGYIPKSSGANAMQEAVRQILDGRIYTPPSVAPAAGGTRLEDMLTSRQTEVLLEMCGGRSNREIADQLGMSENTVRVHVSAIFRLLGVRSRTEAVLVAKRKGLS